MKNKIRKNVIIFTACGYLFLAILAVSYLFIFPYSSLATGGTDESYFVQSKHQRSAGSGAALNITTTAKANSDNLQLQGNFNTTVLVTNQNNIQWTSTTQFNLSTISVLSVDYEFDWVSGSCDIIVPWGGGDSYFNFNITKTADQARTISTTSVSRSDTAIEVGYMLRQTSGSTCNGTLKVYNMFDEDGVDYLNFTTSGGATTTVYIPVTSSPLLASSTCALTGSSTVCDYYYSQGTTTPPLVHITPENSFYIISIFVMMFGMGFWLVRKFT